MGRLYRFILWCLLIVSCLSACGCNTLRGAGKDLERAGQAVQDAFN